MVVQSYLDSKKKDFTFGFSILGWRGLSSDQKQISGLGFPAISVYTIEWEFFFFFLMFKDLIYSPFIFKKKIQAVYTWEYICSK